MNLRDRRSRKQYNSSYVTKKKKKKKSPPKTNNNRRKHEHHYIPKLEWAFKVSFFGKKTGCWFFAVFLHYHFFVHLVFWRVGGGWRTDKMKLTPMGLILFCLSVLSLASLGLLRSSSLMRTSFIFEDHSFLEASSSKTSDSSASFTFWHSQPGWIHKSGYVVLKKNTSGIVQCLGQT